MVTKLIILTIFFSLIYLGYQAYSKSPFFGSFSLPFMDKAHMTIQSSVFQDSAMIPSKYTCDGKNVNPPLEFNGVPITAKSLALIVSDPDSPSGDFTHWILFNINPLENNINENSIPKDTQAGFNDFNSLGYGGPCPLIGIHHYVFTLYALDNFVSLSDSPKKADLIEAMRGHIMDTAKLTGIYEKKTNR